MTPIVALDTETTGVHADRQVWEVGMIRRDDKGERERQFFVAVNLAHADPFGLSVGRFYGRHPMGIALASSTGDVINLRAGENYLSQEDAASAVARWTHGAHIVGAVPNFDTEVLGTLLRNFGFIPAWHYHLVDVEALAAGYLAAKGGVLDCQPPWKSDILASLVGVTANDDERHTALGDARWALRIYDAILGTAS